MKQCWLWVFFPTEVSAKLSKNKQFSLQKKDRMLGMSHFVDILGTYQLENRNQISFLERTDENVTPEKIRAGDILMSETVLWSKPILI